MTGYRTNRNIVYQCWYHVVFCPKYRRKILTSPVDERLKSIIIKTVHEFQQEVIEIEVMPNHVHLLLGCDPQFGIHRLVKQIKGRSSHILRNEFPTLKSRLPSLWTNAYFVQTIGGVTLDILKQYVESQKGK